MSEQHYDFDEFEVVYVEQRKREASDLFNHRSGLPSLGDVVRDLQGRMNIRALYLGDGEDAALHWGRAVNRGIEESDGEIISVMDGDLLFEASFLSRLDDSHGSSDAVILNLHRRMVPEPLGVPRSRWMEQRVDFQACLDACPDRAQPIPPVANNYGPMISARREHWESIGGYDEHRIWSSGLSRIGEDVTRRLEIQVGAASRLLPETICVHPWHPVGFRRDTFAARRMLSLQGQLVEWAKQHNTSDWRTRLEATAAVYTENRRFVERMIRSDVAHPSVTPSRFSRMAAWVSGIAAKLSRREFRQLRGELSTAVRGMKQRGR